VENAAAAAAAIRLPRPHAEYRIPKRSAPRHSHSAILGALSMMHRMRFMRVTRPQSRRSVLSPRRVLRLSSITAGSLGWGNEGKGVKCFRPQRYLHYSCTLIQLFISIVRTRAHTYAFNSDCSATRNALLDKSISRIDIASLYKSRQSRRSSILKSRDPVPSSTKKLDTPVPAQLGSATDSAVSLSSRCVQFKFQASRGLSRTVIKRRVR